MEQALLVIAAAIMMGGGAVGAAVGVGVLGGGEKLFKISFGYRCLQRAFWRVVSETAPSLSGGVR